MSIRPIISNTAMQRIYDADRTRDPHRIGKEIMAVFKERSQTENPTMGGNHQNLLFQQIESALRVKNCFTYLIARDPKRVYTADVRCILPGDSSEKTYYLFMTTLRKPEALAEVLQESSTYDENFEKLKETGFAMPRDDMHMSEQVIDQNDTFERQDPSTGLTAGFRFGDLSVTMDQFNQRVDNILKTEKLKLAVSALAGAIFIFYFSKALFDPK